MHHQRPDSLDDPSVETDHPTQSPNGAERAPRTLRRLSFRADVRRVATAPGTRLAGWAPGLRLLGTESARSRQWAHIGVLVSITAIVVYGTWRIMFTMPLGGWNLVAAWFLVAFEVLPVTGLVIRAVNLWNLD